ncbi:MAG: hypothetical protein AABX86_03135, partial [Nanoarchaeota archaeon]
MAETKETKKPVYTLESARKSLPFTGYGIHRHLVETYSGMLKKTKGSLYIDPQQIEALNNVLAEETEKAVLREVGVKELATPAKGSEAMGAFFQRALGLKELTPKFGKDGSLLGVYEQINRFTQGYR